VEDESVLGMIKALEEEARRVSGRLKSRKADRPLVVEFSGTPKAGKSTVINTLRLFLARNGIQPYVLTERASTCPIRDKKHLFFNVWTACSTLAQMLDASQNGSPYQVVILDRGLFDALVWMRWMQDQGQLGAEDREVIHRFFTLPYWRDRLDILFVMEVAPETSLRREFADQVTRKHGAIMNPKTIEQFNDALELTLGEDAPLFGDRLLRVNTTNAQPWETGHEVVQMTLQALDRLVDSGV
jgi:hypothetical protein